MQNLSSFLPEDLYTEHLSDICDISFTRREIDVMACLLSARKTSKIAYFLSVDPRTVETHIRNITLKLECNTREGIIDFLETSNKVPFLRAHYSSLQQKVSFEKSLKEIAKLSYKENIVRIVTNGENDSCQTSLAALLKTHLRHAGFTIATEERVSESEFLIYGLPQSLSDLPPAFIEKINQHPRTKVLLLLTEGQTKRELPKELKGFDTIRLTKDSNYYFYFFDIVKKIIKNIKMDAIVLNFKEKYKKVGAPKSLDNSQILPKQTPHFFELIKCNMSTRQWVMSAALLVTFFVFIGFLKFYWTSEGETLKQPIVLSELPIPASSTFLERTELLLEIEKGFKSPGGIQTVALVGIGGSGKTTLARQYARQQKANVTWEINAETIESLKGSFEKLAHALVKTEEDEKILRGIQEIKNSMEREEKIIFFVQKQLRSQPNWFLIYDNVEKVADIQKYFPQDSNIWGKGKIILTTRNTNIQNNSQVDGIILMGELNPNQKLSLFMQIMNHGKNKKLTEIQQKKINEFLIQLPPFPLDISAAAYYVKTMNVPYGRYLEQLNNQDKSFSTIQQNLLKEAGAYEKTRYNIITLSLEQLIAADKNFADLLLLVSILDSQNIPRDLLDLYKGKSVVDNFIYHLKKYSLVLNPLSDSTALFSQISIHRSTQEISFSYLANFLKLNKDSQSLKKITYVLDDYSDQTLEQEDFPRMHILARHLEKVLNHSYLLTDFSKGLLESKIGSIYYFINDESARQITGNSFKQLNSKNFDNYSPDEKSRIARSLLHIGAVYTELRLDKEAQEALEKAVQIYGREGSKHHLDLSRALSHLGDLQKRLGHYEKAKDYLEESIHLHKQYGADNKHVARTLAYLGSVYRGLGLYQKAIDTLEESLAIYKKNYTNDHIRIGWILIHLGNVHRRLGNLEKAKDTLERGLIIFQNHFPENHVSMGLVLAYLGGCYRELGDYEKSRHYLERSLSIHQKNFDENHVKMGWISFHLASTYKAMDKNKAQKLFDKVLEIYATHCNEDNIETARMLRNMAKICIEKNRLEDADNYIQRSLRILQSRQHVEAYRSLKTLGEILLKKSTQCTYVKNNQEALDLRNQAIDKFNQALKIADQHFPKGSIHIEKIHAIVKNIKK